MRLPQMLTLVMVMTQPLFGQKDVGSGDGGDSKGPAPEPEPVDPEPVDPEPPVEPVDPLPKQTDPPVVDPEPVDPKPSPKPPASKASIDSMVDTKPNPTPPASKASEDSKVDPGSPVRRTTAPSRPTPGTASSPATTQAPDSKGSLSSDDDKLSGGEVGAIAGGLFGILALILIAICFCRKQDRYDDDDDTGAPTNATSATPPLPMSAYGLNSGSGGYRAPKDKPTLPTSAPQLGRTGSNQERPRRSREPSMNSSQGSSRDSGHSRQARPHRTGSREPLREQRSNANPTPNVGPLQHDGYESDGFGGLNDSMVDPPAYNDIDRASYEL